MKTVSDIVRSSSPAALGVTLSSVSADFSTTLPVKLKYGTPKIPADPLAAGTGFHDFLCRMADTGPLSNRERAYLPFLSAARLYFRNMGVWQMDIESAVEDPTTGVHGVCDLIVRGGPRRIGFVEFKLVAEGVTGPRPRDLAQLGLYMYLGRKWAKSSWGALVYVEPYAFPAVKIFGYHDATLPQAVETIVPHDVAA